MQGGFTVVELLVVIAIVGVLMAMTMPSMLNAREAGRMAVCLNYERQQGIGFGVYLNDFKSAYPYGFQSTTPIGPGTYINWGAATSIRWYENLGPYVNTYSAAKTKSKLMRCPSNPWGTGTTYGMNAYPTGKTGSAFRYNYGDTSNPDPYYNMAIFYKTTRTDDLKRPTLTCLLAEVPNMAATDNAWGGTYTDLQLQYTSFTGVWSSEEITRYARFNHNLSWNTLMADSSAKNRSKPAMYALKALTGTSNDWTWFWYNR